MKFCQLNTRILFISFLSLVGTYFPANRLLAQVTLPTATDTAIIVKRITAISVNYLGISAYQERSIGGRSTSFLYGAGGHYSFYSTSLPILGTRFIYVRDKAFGREYSTSAITPYLFAELRTYFNLFKRALRGKNIHNNAASYLSLFGEIPLLSGHLNETANLDMAYPVGVKVGWRRNLSKRLYIDASGALVGKIHSVQTKVAPRLDAAVVFAL